MTSSAAWMMALALYEHGCGQTISQIRLAGIEMLIGTEYARQKPCLEWWLGLAMGKGIDVMMAPTGSAIMTDGIYAIDYLETMAKDAADFVYPVVANLKGTHLPRVAIAEHNGVPLGL
jgi:hypothetical protein